jgi:hypothetical protein
MAKSDPIRFVYDNSLKAILRQQLCYVAQWAGFMATGAFVSYLAGDDYWWDQEIPFPWAFPRFISPADNIQDDMYTGLYWVADPALIGPDWNEAGDPKTMTWDEAIQKCNALNYAGHDDWRLPNENELETLLDFGQYHPAINKEKFPNTKGDYYWSSSITNYGCDNEFVPSFKNGHTNWTDKKTDKRYVRPVRGRLVPWHGGKW